MALESIARKRGVKVEMEATVDSLQWETHTNTHKNKNTGNGTSKEKKRVRSVTYTDKQGHSSVITDVHAVVSNIDVGRGERLFIPTEVQDERATCGRPSCGIVSIHIAFDTVLSPLQVRLRLRLSLRLSLSLRLKGIFLYTAGILCHTDVLLPYAIISIA